MGLGAQYASSVVAASGGYALARASSETHVALCIRLSIPSTTRQRDDKNRIIEFSMNLSSPGRSGRRATIAKGTK